ncbi:hypothetical protein BDZ89DRAFT_1083118 [Hymenopellis radicata]|nr:hypothetical protein BDZ89DRAFT_1083118 [Hymenopellis radicata]
MQRLPLPVELLQLITSCLSSDRRALCALSLTCRAFLPIARRHPFRTIGPYYLDSRDALVGLRQALNELPGLGATVRAFKVYSEPQDGICADLVGIVNDLVNLQEVDLRWMSIPEVQGTEMIAMCEAFQARRVTAARFDNLSFSRPREFHAMLRFFPLLLSLALQNCNIADVPSPSQISLAESESSLGSAGLAITSPSTSDLPICRLQMLEIDHDTDGTRLVDILLQEQCPIDFSGLRVLKVMGAHEQGSVDSILRRATAVLR